MAGPGLVRERDALNEVAATTGLEAEDARFMALAFALGRRGLGNCWPNPAVGAVVVRHTADGPVIVGRGWTQPGGRPHAEAEALRRAGAAARGATLYATLEPCSHHGKTPPCADAVITAGIARVVSAMDDPNPEVAGSGHARLRAHGVAVTVGVGAAEAARVHAGHISRVREGRPYVTLKLAVSADEKAGLAGRRPAAITGEATRARVHLMRAAHDAVLTGIGTALADDPLLTCRLPGLADRSPVRVVLDSRLRLLPDSKLVASAGQVPLWVVTGPEASPEIEKALRGHGVEVLRAEGPAADTLDLEQVLRALADRGITRLMVEAGPILSSAFVAADLIDEAVLLRGPEAIGADGIDALEGMPLSALTEASNLEPVGSEAVGDDRFETFERV
jgi:diaminohydroxyphosphoribosylaminopyrimidine deaminase/5-amino-6-(5-phosphoribosylamino)uracil reductase